MSSVNSTQHASTLSIGVESTLKMHLGSLERDLATCVEVWSARLEENSQEKELLKGKATVTETIVSRLSSRRRMIPTFCSSRCKRRTSTGAGTAAATSQKTHPTILLETAPATKSHEGTRELGTLKEKPGFGASGGNGRSRRAHSHSPCFYLRRSYAIVFAT
jgi:hypothetical protein